MDLIEMTRNLGREIQKDERYLKMQLALQSANGDEGLQDLIGQYNLKRVALQAEGRKKDRDQQKMQTYTQELNGLYETIMKNPNMAAYNGARAEMNGLMRRVNAIIEQSAEGADPDTADYAERSCGGDCGACGGCH